MTRSTPHLHLPTVSDCKVPSEGEEKEGKRKRKTEGGEEGKKREGGGESKGKYEERNECMGRVQFISNDDSAITRVILKIMCNNIIIMLHNATCIHYQEKI